MIYFGNFKKRQRKQYGGIFGGTFYLTQRQPPVFMSFSFSFWWTSAPPLEEEVTVIAVAFFFVLSQKNYFDHRLHTLCRWRIKMITGKIVMCNTREQIQSQCALPMCIRLLLCFFRWQSHPGPTAEIPRVHYVTYGCSASRTIRC